MHHFIVIGNPITHSKSPLIHAQFAHQTGLKITYNRQYCPNTFDSFKAVVEAFFNGGGTGANVTLPFKEWAYQLCLKTGALSDFARTAGAVNTLAIKNGKLYGDNTDGRGLVADLLSKNISLKSRTIAILGAGGAARGVILPLLQAGANVCIFNRTIEKARTLVESFEPFKNNQLIFAHSLDELSGEFDLIINATSAATNNQALNLDNKTLSTQYAYDMAYGKRTEFMTHFKDKAVVYDGTGMLIYQAVFSFELWTKLDTQKIDLKSIKI